MKQSLELKDIEAMMNQIAFIMNRMDNIAFDIVSWMPPEDNKKHHNAVEMLQRAYVVAQAVQERLVQAYGGQLEVDRLHLLNNPDWLALKPDKISQLREILNQKNC